MKNRIKLFTHTDLDGIGCSLLFLKNNKISKEDIEYLDYTNINETITEFIYSCEYKNYDKIYITDISVDEDIAETIDYINKNESVQFILYDHHKTALPLNEYNWAKVVVEEDNIKTCGTSLLYHNEFNTIGLEDFVETIRQWDTWDWSIVKDGYKANHLNTLLFIFKRDKFIELCASNDYNVDKIINNELSKCLLEIEGRNKKDYIKRKSQTGVNMVLSIPINNIKREYNVYLVCADKYISELGNTICKKNPEYDLCIMIDLDRRALSYRSVKEDIDCSEIAKYFNGGGHPRTAGSEFLYVSKKNLYDTLFNTIMKTHSGNYAILDDYYNIV